VTTAMPPRCATNPARCRVGESEQTLVTLVGLAHCRGTTAPGGGPRGGVRRDERVELRPGAPGRIDDFARTWTHRGPPREGHLHHPRIGFGLRLHLVPPGPPNTLRVRTCDLGIRSGAMGSS
jgi:hypothetical protein